MAIRTLGLLGALPVLGFSCARKHDRIAGSFEEWCAFLDRLFDERPAHAFYPMTEAEFHTTH
jgi:hypothetical protein